jgi:phage/plasmid-associated DNA primase
VFKAITGGNKITAEYKFRGFFDRWIVIPFDRAFRGKENEIPKETLDAELTATSELSGLLSRALDGLETVRSRNWKSPDAGSLRLAECLVIAARSLAFSLTMQIDHEREQLLFNHCHSPRWFFY